MPPEAAKPALEQISYGLYVVGSKNGDEVNGMTANWLTQVSFEPLLLAISVNPGNDTWSLIEQSGRFAINVLASGQQELARHFGLQSGRDIDKFAAAIQREIYDKVDLNKL